jgi:hypothetical protein
MLLCVWERVVCITGMPCCILVCFSSSSLRSEDPPPEACCLYKKANRDSISHRVPIHGLIKSRTNSNHIKNMIYFVLTLVDLPLRVTMYVPCGNSVEVRVLASTLTVLTNPPLIE